MTLPDVLGSLQVFLAVIALFAPYYISNAVLPRFGNYLIICSPQDGDGDDVSRRWIVSIECKKAIGETPPMICLYAKPRNHIERLVERRSALAPRRITLNELGYVEIETKNLPKRQILTFEIEFFYSDVPEFRQQNSVYRKVSYQIYADPAAQNNRSLLKRSLIIAKWRALWIAVGLCLYAACSLVRIFYLGYFVA